MTAPLIMMVSRRPVVALPLVVVVLVSCLHRTASAFSIPNAGSKNAARVSVSVFTKENVSASSSSSSTTSSHQQHRRQHHPQQRSSSPSSHHCRHSHRQLLHQVTTTTTFTSLFALDDENNENDSDKNESSNLDSEGTANDSASSSSATTTQTTMTTLLDKILARGTSAFPLWVLASALLAVKAPASLQWVNRGSLITVLLALVMMGTGMTLETEDFAEVLKENSAAVPAGVLCQYSIMPLAAFLIGKLLLRGEFPTLYLGLILVGCSPGGTASNLVSLIAGANVALSVLLTACSTVLAAAVTPALVLLLVGSLVPLNGWSLCRATIQVVLAPVLAGMALNARAPKFSQQCSRFTPFASVVLVALICGGVVAQNAQFLTSGSVSASLLPRLLSCVVLLHGLGFTVGYLVPRLGFGFSETTARTVSIETGMQNSALAVVLAKSLMSNDGMKQAMGGGAASPALPGALSATVHSCLGSILAAYWRWMDSKNQTETEGTSTVD